MSIINVHGYDKSNAKCSEDTVHRFVLAGGFRILPELRSRIGISVVASGDGSDLTVSSHSCSDSLGGTTVVNN